jgi:aspartate/methionine/tyrosine aminotransferase
LTCAAAHVGQLAGRSYDPVRECVSAAGGLNGILNALLAIAAPGDEVVLADPIYAGLVNRIRLVGATPVHVPSVPTAEGWRTDPDRLAAAIGPRAAAVLLMSPAMPTGAVYTRHIWTPSPPAWSSPTHGCSTTRRWNGLRFDGRPVLRCPEWTAH